MRLALTGASGFLGRHFTRAALEAGHEVRALLRSGAAADPRAEVVAGDLQDGAALQRLVRGAEVLVHLAALGVRSRDRDWQRAVGTNVVAPLALLEAAARAGLSHVLAAGTCLEYAGFGTLPQAPWPAERGLPLCSEEAPLGTGDAYGASKAAGGIVCRARAQDLGLPMWYLRLATLYGPGDAPDRVLPAALRRALRGEPFPMTPGEQVREWLHVGDAVGALLAAVERCPPAHGAVLNVGTGVGVTLGDLVQRVFASAGASATLARPGALPYRVGEAHVLVMDVSQARGALGLGPPVSLEAGLGALAQQARREEGA